MLCYTNKYIFNAPANMCMRVPAYVKITFDICGPLYRLIFAHISAINKCCFPVVCLAL